MEGFTARITDTKPMLVAKNNLLIDDFAKYVAEIKQLKEEVKSLKLLVRHESASAESASADSAKLTFDVVGEVTTLKEQLLDVKEERDAFRQLADEYFADWLRVSLELKEAKRPWLLRLRSKSVKA